MRFSGWTVILVVLTIIFSHTNANEMGGRTLRTPTRDFFWFLYDETGDESSYAVLPSKRRAQTVSPQEIFVLPLDTTVKVRARTNVKIETLKIGRCISWNL